LRVQKQWKCRESKSEVLCGNVVNYVPVTVIWLQVGRYIVWTKETVNEYRNLIGNFIGKLPFGSRCVDDKLTASTKKEFQRMKLKLYELRLERSGKTC
jgi:hypothetical protein